MARRGDGLGGAVLAVVAVVLCCGLPALIVLSGGILAAVGGAAVRFWPLTLLGVAALVWGGARLRSLLAARSRARSRAYGSSDGHDD